MSGKQTPVLSGFDDHMEREEPGYKARRAREAIAQREVAAAKRRALIREHGSEDAANALNRMERLVDEAARPFERLVPRVYANGVFSVMSLDGWSGSVFGTEPSEVLRSAVSGALPLPATIQEAADEYAAWEQRDDERRALSGDELADTKLSLGCCLRRDIVRNLLETGLRATNIADVLERQRYFVALEFPAPEIDRAVLADLEYLAQIISADQSTLRSSTDKKRPRRRTISQLRAKRCGECGTKQGNLHERGCPWEYCAQCGEQAVACGHNDDPIATLPRVPFIMWANVCGSCGALNPDFFDVPSTVWRHYIEPAKRELVICQPCWQQIVHLIDDGRYQGIYGVPTPLWSPEFRRRHSIAPDVPSPWDGTTEADWAPWPQGGA
jgi:hypothetical protein